MAAMHRALAPVFAMALLVGCSGGRVLSDGAPPPFAVLEFDHPSTIRIRPGYLDNPASISSIRPLWSDSASVIRSQPGQKQFLLAEGWYIVAYNCAGDLWVDHDPEATIHVHAGRRYIFDCRFESSGAIVKENGAAI
jgi:hypothetical protein